MEQPRFQWTPSVAPSGLVFLRSARYGSDWQGSAFTGSLKFRYLSRLVMQGGQVAREERLLTDLGERIRDVAVGPDGAVWVITDEPNGMKAFFWMQGANEFFDENGNHVETLDVWWFMNHYETYCRENGIAINPKLYL